MAKTRYPAVVLFVLMLVLTSIISAVNGVADATPLTALVAGAACGGLTLAGYVWTVRYLEGRRTLQELASAQARQGLQRGAALGLGLFTVTIALVAMFGGYHVHGWGSIGGALTTLGVMAGVAVVEELTFRGVLFGVLEEKTGTLGAVAVSALSVSGPRALTGGAFGPEASIFAILVCIVPTVLFLRAAKRRNRIRAFRGGGGAGTPVSARRRR